METDNGRAITENGNRTLHKNTPVSRIEETRGPIMTMLMERQTTFEDIKRRLNEAHARINFEGRFTLSIDQTPPLKSGKETGGYYITHWFRPTPYAFEDCKAVGSGNLDDCLDSLDSYVSRYQRQPTQEELARTLGLPEKPVNRRAVVTGYGDITAQAAEFRELAGADAEVFFRQGWAAHVGKADISECPYGADFLHAWEQGWMAANRYLSP